MNAALNQTLAAKAGNNSDGQTWAEAYDYHLGAVQAPLPFEVFRRKHDLLSSYLKSVNPGSYRAVSRNALPKKWQKELAA